VIGTTIIASYTILKANKNYYIVSCFFFMKRLWMLLAELLRGLEAEENLLGLEEADWLEYLRSE